MSMKIFFNNCLGSCPNAVLSLDGRTSVSKAIDHAVGRWGEGRMIRNDQNELVWIKDHDGDWRGCCELKVRGRSCQ